jgi:hypothetical protein
MGIKLTRKIDGKEAEMGVIFLNGKAVVSDDSFQKLKKRGFTKDDLKKQGFGLEADELKKIASKK